MIEFDMVGHHHSYHVIDDIDFQILIESDFLITCMNAIDNEGIIKYVNNTSKHLLESNSLMLCTTCNNLYILIFYGGKLMPQINMIIAGR